MVAEAMVFQKPFSAENLALPFRIGPMQKNVFFSSEKLELHSRAFDFRFILLTVAILLTTLCT